MIGRLCAVADASRAIIRMAANKLAVGQGEQGEEEEEEEEEKESGAGREQKEWQCWASCSERGGAVKSIDWSSKVGPLPASLPASLPAGLPSVPRCWG